MFKSLRAFLYGNGLMSMLVHWLLNVLAVTGGIFLVVGEEYGKKDWSVWLMAFFYLGPLVLLHAASIDDFKTDWKRIVFYNGSAAIANLLLVLSFAMGDSSQKLGDLQNVTDYDKWGVFIGALVVGIIYVIAHVILLFLDRKAPEKRNAWFVRIVFNLLWVAMTWIIEYSTEIFGNASRSSMWVLWFYLQIRIANFDIHAFNSGNTSTNNNGYMSFSRFSPEMKHGSQLASSKYADIMAF